MGAEVTAGLNSPKEPLKHERILSSLCYMAGVVERADGIADRIQGCPSPEGPSDIPSEMSLSETLEAVPDVVSTLGNKLEDTLERLNRLLF